MSGGIYTQGHGEDGGKKKIYLFWLHWVFVAAHGLSLVVVSSGYSLVVVLGLLSAVASLVVEHGLQYFWNTDLVALWYVESSRTRDRTHVPCLAKRIRNH